MGQLLHQNFFLGKSNLKVSVYLGVIMPSTTSPSYQPQPLHLLIPTEAGPEHHHQDDSPDGGH